jgi:hypothetical protein
VDWPESFPKLVGVLDTNDNFALGMATVALGEAGIVYDTVAIPDLPENLEAEKPKWWIPPTRILVGAEDASEARSKRSDPRATLRQVPRENFEMP